MLLVFIGGKSAPSGLVFGKVYELPNRYASFAYYEVAPEDAKAGDIVPVKPRKSKTPEKKPAPKKKLTIAPGFTGKVRLVFNEKAKSAPKGNYVHGQTYELPARYASFPWFDLIEPVPELKVEILEEESIYQDDKSFVPGKRDSGPSLIPIEEMKHPERINRGSMTPKTDDPETTAPTEEPVVETPIEVKAKEHKPFKDMTKDELAAFVKEKGGEITERDTKRTLTGKALALETA